MAGSKTTYLTDLLLNWLKASAFPAAPATVYIALFTAAPGEGGGGTEVAGNAYVRMACALSVISGAGPRQVSNSAQIDWPAATPAGWGTITHAALFDALTVGNMLYYADLAAPVAVAAGNVFRLNAAAAVFTEQ